MIDREQPVTAAAVDREVGDVIVVVAEALRLIGRALGLGIEVGHVGNESIAPAQQHVGAIARGDMMRLVDAGIDLGEIEAIGGGPSLGVTGSECRGAEQRRGRRHAERAAHHRAAAIAPHDHLADGLALGWAAGNIVMGLARRGPVAEFVSVRHMPIDGGSGPQI